VDRDVFNGFLLLLLDPVGTRNHKDKPVLDVGQKDGGVEAVTKRDAFPGVGSDELIDQFPDDGVHQNEILGYLELLQLT